LECCFSSHHPPRLKLGGFLLYLEAPMKYLLLALALTACAPAVIQSQPVPVVVVAPAPVVTVPPVVVPAPVPVPAPIVVIPAPVVPASLPTGPLVTLDASVLTVTLKDSTLTIKLTDDAKGTWFRLTLPDGTASGITDIGPCHCLGLGGASAHLLNVSFLAGLVISTSPTLDGPWTVAARTQ
jgi:hypothetical protein